MLEVPQNWEFGYLQGEAFYFVNQSLSHQTTYRAEFIVKKDERDYCKIIKNRRGYNGGFIAMNRLESVLMEILNRRGEFVRRTTVSYRLNHKTHDWMKEGF